MNSANLERLLNPRTSAIYENGIWKSLNPNLKPLADRWRKFTHHIDNSIGRYVIEYLIDKDKYKLRPQPLNQLEVLAADGLPNEAGAVNIDLQDNGFVNNLYNKIGNKTKDTIANIFAMPAMAYWIRGNSPDQAYNVVHEAVHRMVQLKRANNEALPEKETYIATLEALDAALEGPIASYINRAYLEDMKAVAERALQLYLKNPYEGTKLAAQEKHNLIMNQLQSEINTGKLVLKYDSKNSVSSKKQLRSIISSTFQKYASR